MAAIDRLRLGALIELHDSVQIHLDHLLGGRGPRAIRGLDVGDGSFDYLGVAAGLCMGAGRKAECTKGKEKRSEQPGMLHIVLPLR